MGQLPQQATVVNILDSFHDNMGPMLSTPTPPEAPKRALPWSASCLMLTVVPSPATLKGKPSSWWSDHFGENDRGTINIKILDRSDSTVTEVKVGQKSFNTVDEFCYLGGTISSKVFLIYADIICWIAKVLATFAHFSWRLKHLGCPSVLKPTLLLYNCETWTAKWGKIRQLYSFHMLFLHQIAGINWEDRMTNTEVLNSWHWGPYTGGMSTLVWVCCMNAVSMHDCVWLTWAVNVDEAKQEKKPKTLAKRRERSILLCLTAFPENSVITFATWPSYFNWFGWKSKL